MGKISYNWSGTNPGLEEKTENERFTVVSSRSRSCRAEYGKKLPKCVQHMQHACFFSLLPLFGGVVVAVSVSVAVAVAEVVS